MPRLFNNPTAADRLNDWVARRAVVRCRGRAVLGRLRSRRASRRFRAEKQPARVHVAVSYTHLDVYKRQPWD